MHKASVHWSDCSTYDQYFAVNFLHPLFTFQSGLTDYLEFKKLIKINLVEFRKLLALYLNI